MEEVSFHQRQAFESDTVHGVYSYMNHSRNSLLLMIKNENTRSVRDFFFLLLLSAYASGTHGAVNIEISYHISLKQQHVNARMLEKTITVTRRAAR